MKRHFIARLHVPGAIVAWLVLAILFLLVPPVSFWLYLLFVTTLFFALTLTVSLFVPQKRYGWFAGVGIVGLLLLYQYHQATVVNIALFAGVMLSVEVYIRQRAA